MRLTPGYAPEATALELAWRPLSRDPPSELYHYEPLDETVPVYQQPFRLVQEVTVPMNEETAALAAAPAASC